MKKKSKGNILSPDEFHVFEFDIYVSSYGELKAIGM
jgi:hypothetical protein